MRLTLPLFKASSSGRWLARQGRDHFVSSKGSYRARSAFKLLELCKKHRSLLGSRVVDLGAAPGGWSQVAATRSKKVVAVDLLPIEAISGVHVVQGDFFNPDIQSKVKDILGGQADSIVSDMMADMSGVRDRDVQASLDLVGAATYFAGEVLRREEGEGEEMRKGGNLVMKFFLHPDLVRFRKTILEKAFARVVTEKPEASRKESSEAYWVCLGFKGLPTESPAP